MTAKTARFGIRDSLVCHPSPVTLERVNTPKLKKGVSLRDVLVAFASLVEVLDHALLLQLPHALDLIKIDNKARVV